MVAENILKIKTDHTSFRSFSYANKQIVECYHIHYFLHNLFRFQKRVG